jgi:hypothetical protein
VGNVVVSFMGTTHVVEEVSAGPGRRTVAVRVRAVDDVGEVLFQLCPDDMVEVQL